MRIQICSLLLESIRSALYVLGKIDVNNSNSDNPIYSSFHELQTLLRFNSHGIDDSFVIVSPFIMLLRAPNMASPLKLVALKSIHSFLKIDVLGLYPSSAPKTLAEIIDAVASCKFLQTDFVGDEIVQVQIFEVLYGIFDSKMNIYIDADSLEKVALSCYGVITSEDISSNICDAAERTLLQALCFAMRTIVASGMNRGCIDHSALLKLLRLIQKPIVDATKWRTLVNGSSDSYSFISMRSTHSVVIANLSFCLRAFHTLLFIVSGDELVNLVSSDSDLSNFFLDEFAFNLLALCCCREMYPAQILQIALDLFSTLFATIGSNLKILVESFCVQIYLKAILQLIDRLQEISIPHKKMKSDDRTSNTQIYREHFTISEFEIILDSLCDLFALPVFLPSIYASFDCDIVKQDILIPLVSNLARCCRLALLGHIEDEILPRSIQSKVILVYKVLLKGFAFRSKKWQAFFDSRVHIGSRENESKSYGDTISAEDDGKIISMFQNFRFAKSLLAEAAEHFSQKPLNGIKKMLDQGTLLEPVSPESIAQFLRINPFLSKEVVGGYLGELGKDTAAHASESKEFHRDVLIRYVESFELGNQSILVSLRIFLSAFRLPGEAQQIDRILVSFSEHCFKNSPEGISGMIENSEVCYLLTFSIIMLNTDRHNPNIKEERKMTKDQFVRNNTNYGRDVNQTLPLTRDYLEGIFDSIVEMPIRTEGNDLSAVITKEMWLDWQMQAFADKKKTLLISTNSPMRFSTDILDVQIDITAPELVRTLLSAKIGSLSVFHPMALSKIISCKDWIFDFEIFKSVWMDHLRVGTCVYLDNYKRLLYESSNNEFNNMKDISKTNLRESNEFLLHLLKVASIFRMVEVCEIVITLLIELSGIMKPTTFHMLNPDELDESLYQPVYGTGYIFRLLKFPFCRFALINLLQALQTDVSSHYAWRLLWKSLSFLRDCRLLPAALVVDTEKDLLPSNIRSEFEEKLLLLEDKNLFGDNSKTMKRSSNSILSLQGLGEAIFGSTADGDNPNVPLDYETEMNNHCRLSARWDQGYEVENMSQNGNANSKYTHDNHVKDLRRLLSKSSIGQIISDTRLMSNERLVAVVSALVDVSNSPLQSFIDHNEDEPHDKYIQSFETRKESIDTDLKISQASLAWMEMVLVDIVIRNRDRFGILWPTLKLHYIRTLGSGSVNLCYVTERRITGLFKITSRLLSRKTFTGEILMLLGKLLHPSSKVTFDATRQDIIPIRYAVVQACSNQISAAMWGLLTSNVELLPLLPLDEWQIIFSVIATTSSCGTFSAIKSFETMAWLLHEPRLLAKVPVFCILSINPLVKNTSAPLSVSVGAVRLLTHLHARLEVLIKDEYEDCDASDGETPLLWENCWTPILKSFSEGIKDVRQEVQLACSDALCRAIKDKHSKAVPAGVLVVILGDIFSNTIISVVSSYFPLSGATSEMRKFTNATYLEAETADPPINVSPFLAQELVTSPQQAERCVALTIVENCLESLCQVYIAELSKLSKYPSFDKLWIKIMSVLSYFLAGESKSQFKLRVDSAQMVKLCEEKLQQLLVAMEQNRIFEVREGLRSVTDGIIQHLSPNE